MERDVSFQDSITFFFSDKIRHTVPMERLNEIIIRFTYITFLRNEGCLW